MVNGPNGAGRLAQLNTFPTMKARPVDPGVPWTDVGAWPAVEPAIDFTSTAALAHALTTS